MKQLIKDVETKACICSQDNGAIIERTGKQRALTWMGAIVVVVGIPILLFGQLESGEIFDAKGLLVIAVISYIFIRIALKFHKYIKKHTLWCSLRRAYFDIV